MGNNISLAEKAIKSKRALIIDFTHFGLLGFILFVLAVALVYVLSLMYDYSAMVIGIGIFICGGFSGRCIQKQMSKK